MRAFLAIELPGRLARLIEELLTAHCGELPPARWAPRRNLHLTLHFLGDVDDGWVKRHDAALSELAVRHQSHQLVVSSAGAFSPRRARILWLGFEPNVGLMKLQAELVRICEAEHAARPFRPHLTLARCRVPWRRPDVDDFVERARVLEGETLPVERFVLVESELSSRGARYRVVAAYELSKSEP